MFLNCWAAVLGAGCSWARETRKKTAKKLNAKNATILPNGRGEMGIILWSPVNSAENDCEGNRGLCKRWHPCSSPLQGRGFPLRRRNRAIGVKSLRPRRRELQGHGLSHVTPIGRSAFPGYAEI